MRLCVMASWRGTNFKAIMDHVRLGVLRGVEVPLLIYTDEGAPVKAIAEAYGVDAVYIKHKGVPRGEREKGILEVLEAYGVDAIALAGYDYILGSAVVEKYRWRVLNIHPSLLPFAGGKGMYGRRVHMEVFKAGVRATGATVHLVDESVDGGPIVDQWPVYIGDIYGLPLEPDEKIDLIADRVLLREHRLYSRAVQLLADGLVEVEEAEVKAPKVVEGGGGLRYVEEPTIVRRAVVRAGPAWHRDWAERQRAYVELQLAEWRRAGRPLELILGPDEPWRL